MNNARFIKNPVSLDVQRSRFNRDFNHKTTFNVGELVPFFVDEVLPGDTFDIKTSFVARLSTLKVPVMDNLFIDFAYFFVPNRIVMDKWAEVMGENKTSMWKPVTETLVPIVKYEYMDDYAEYVKGLGTIADYMGISFMGVNDAQYGTQDYEINVLPFRAYTTIYNEFYRSENLQDPIYCPTDALDRSIELDDDPAITTAHLGYSPLLIANKVPDYFTSCLPEPQKGPSVVIPVGLVAPVKTQTDIHADSISWPTLKWNKSRDSVGFNHLIIGSGAALDASKTRTDIGPTESPGSSVVENIAPANLVADLSQATATTINELRNAFQLQRLYEKDARGGTRYTEMITSHFGVRAPDSMLQRPQFLGGSRKPINISQVLATAQNDADDTALADTGAFSLTGGMPAAFNKSFVEHGFVIGVCVVRYEHTYAKGLERFWFRKRRFDYYDPVFANIGEQPVMTREIDYRVGDNTTVFGYQEAWADYRYKPSRVSAEMKNGVPSGSLYYWHFADEPAQVPTLSESWLAEDKNNVDRALAVTSKLSRQIIADIFVQNTCTRVMPLYSVPGLIDHN